MSTEVRARTRERSIEHCSVKAFAIQSQTYLLQLPEGGTKVLHVHFALRDVPTHRIDAHSLLVVCVHLLDGAAVIFVRFSNFPPPEVSIKNRVSFEVSENETFRFVSQHTHRLHFLLPRHKQPSKMLIEEKNEK